MFGGNDKLKFDLECFTQSKADLEAAIERLTEIQDKLAKAMEALVEADAWDSKGSAAFTKKYEATWVKGIETRKNVMQRMCDHMQEAYNEYEPVKTEAENLKIETN